MLGTIIDTVIICTMTGLSIVITGAWDMGLEGVSVTTKAFQIGLPFPEQVASFVLMLCLVFFAFTTILGWNYYSEKMSGISGWGQKDCFKGISLAVYPCSVYRTIYDGICCMDDRRYL